MDEEKIFEKIDKNTKMILEAMRLQSEFLHMKLNLVEKKATTDFDDSTVRTLVREEGNKKEELMNFLSEKNEEMDKNIAEDKPKQPKSYY